MGDCRLEFSLVYRVRPNLFNPFRILIHLGNKIITPNLFMGLLEFPAERANVPAVSEQKEEMPRD